MHRHFWSVGWQDDCDIEVVIHSSFIGQCYQLRAKGATERLKIPTAHEGKTAANCSIPAITVVANEAATRAAAPNKRIVKTTG